MLVLPKALGIQPINLQKQPNFLKEYKENSIDYTTCDEVHDPYDDPEYATSISDKRYTHKTLANCPAAFLSYFHCGFFMKYNTADKYKGHNEQYKSAE